MLCRSTLTTHTTYVTAISFSGKSRPLEQGFYVFGNGTTLPTTNFAVRAKVTVVGTVSDFTQSGNTASRSDASSMR